MFSLISLISVAVIVARSVGASPRLDISSGCGQTPPITPGEFKKFTTSGDREYRVWLPETYDSNKQTPLILSYHGAKRDITRQANLDKLTDPLFNRDYIVVYLQGTSDDPDDPERTGWQGAPGHASNDIGFTSDVLDTVTAALCVDKRRIFATGKSQGGGFVGRLACDPQMSARIAAFAPVSGAYYITEITKESDCHPETVEVPCDASPRNIPIMAFHGGNDSTIRYHGDFRSGACLPDVSSWAKQWALRDGLDGTPINTTIPEADNGMIMSYGGGLVTLVYDGDNIGHDWPSTTVNSDNEREGHERAKFNASEWIMDFFREHSLPA
ncbi:carbohydrate esterase family 1 protein [Xylariaceae sp. FL0662B]|nr:carbohydrate esterase family 1 protein [Xylariaceae sp. FL0662B]